MLEIKAKSESYKTTRDAMLKVEMSRMEGKIAKEEAIENVCNKEEKGQSKAVSRCIRVKRTNDTEVNIGNLQD